MTRTFKLHIEDNVKLGKLAHEVHSLAASEVQILLKDLDITHAKHFWECLSELIDEHLPKEQVPVKELPMTLQEVRRFEAETMPYGELRGIDIRNVPVERLLWYDEHPQEFAKKLK
ncbi:hypothetical protein LCGC14_0357210 [marine sediment metagenome]|uniref:Uncharacterized protein n=1 Tax=marine sediment metagenome TaxID=412755 RepID=A0A0F9TS05_9ZZZZ